MAAQAEREVGGGIFVFCLKQQNGPAHTFRLGDLSSLMARRELTQPRLCRELSSVEQLSVALFHRSW